MQKVISTLLLGTLSLCAFSQSLSNYDKALYGFNRPQDSTRTKVWWFHGETETTPEARQVGLIFDLHISNGFVSGGPSITPELSMQRLSSKQTVIQGELFIKFGQ